MFFEDLTAHFMFISKAAFKILSVSEWKMAILSFSDLDSFRNIHKRQQSRVEKLSFW